MLSKRQYEVLSHIEAHQRPIEKWMHTATIASLIKHRYAVVVCNRKSISLKITDLGKMVRTSKELDYRATLKDTAALRRKYRNVA